MKDLKKIRKIAVKAAKMAGKHAFRNVHNIKKIEHKEGINNLVTNIDKKCEDIIVSTITKHFPTHSILAEEGGEKLLGQEYTWVIDPLDGTTNFAHAFPFFCVSIGVIVDGEVKVGVVYEPNRDELFEAVSGAGAYLNGERISVSKNVRVQDSLVATGFPYNVEGKKHNLKLFTHMLDKAQAIRRAGAAALDLCYVACGRLDGFWELGLAPWDTAAGQLIVKESGGAVSHLDGSEFSIYSKEIVATNGLIHEEILKSLTKTESSQD